MLQFLLEQDRLSLQCSPETVRALEALFAVNEASVTVELAQAVGALLDAPCMQGSAVQLARNAAWRAATTAVSVVCSRLNDVVNSEISTSYGVSRPAAAAAVDDCVRRLHSRLESILQTDSKVQAQREREEARASDDWGQLSLHRRRTHVMGVTQHLGLLPVSDHLRNATTARRLKQVAVKVRGASLIL